MAEKAKGGKGEKKKTQKYKFYKVDGASVKRERKFCPKCGAGVFMAQHKNRASCGKCGYSEAASSTGTSKKV